MFDFLDKTGLKAVLEQIKAKFPSSLPANGGNADYAAVASDTQLFNGKPSGNYVQFLGVVQVDDMSTAPVNTYEYLNDSTYQVSYEVAVSPLVSVFMGLPNIWWLIKYYVYGYGNGYSCQTAFPVGFGGVPYIRYSGEGVWSDWKEISTTPIKSTTFSSNADGTGNFNLWAQSENKVPISMQLDNKTFYAVPFLYNNQMWLGSTINEITRQPVTDTSVRGTIYYIEV